MKRLSTWAAMALVLASPLSAQQTDQQATSSEPAALSADTVLATVNGTDITLRHLILARSSLPPQYDSFPPEALFDGILEQLISQQALVDSVDGEIGSTLEARIENERRGLIANDRAQGFAEDAVTEEDIQAAYDERFAGVEPATEYDAAHILVETEEEAQAIVEELEQGADFATLAQERSTGPSGPNGGSLGWFGEGAMVAPFEEAVQGLEPGEVSAPVQTQFGWHVIRLNDTRSAALPPLEAVRDEIAQTLVQDAMREEIARITDAANVERKAEGIDPAAALDPALLADD